MSADVCLILEGTYPFVTGGVSSWVHRLVTKLNDLTFTIVHLSPKPDYYPKGHRYTLPDNVVGVREVYLQHAATESDMYSVPAGKWRETIETFQRLMTQLRDDDVGAFDNFFRAVNEEANIEQLKLALLNSPEGWDVMLETYREEASREGLLQFFWTWRFALLPFLNVLTAPLPDARMFHTVCTGYAGVLAAGAVAATGRPMVLTEHGIYAKERRIDIQRATWIPDGPASVNVTSREAPYFKRFWMRQFAMMSRECYRAADDIYTLYQGNAELQMRDGAPAEKIHVVPNGIDLSRFGAAPTPKNTKTKPTDPFVVGFVGRVCPIKDIRTLLRTARLVLDRYPNVTFRVMGPYDEDPEYVADCESLRTMLRLDDHVVFEGRVNVLEEYPKIDLCVLSSISEAQPLVILEAGAFGIPTVATDVGSCSELLMGDTPEEKARGEGGLVVPIASPDALAGAIETLVEDRPRLARMGACMSARVRERYDERDMVARYESIYKRHVFAAAEAS